MLLFCGVLFFSFKLPAASYASPAYYLKAVVPEWDLKTICLGMADFMVIQCFDLGYVLSRDCPLVSQVALQ
jgi:hypothetical protein